jgi:hypothetical protein
MTRARRTWLVAGGLAWLSVVGLGGAMAEAPAPGAAAPGGTANLAFAAADKAFRFDTGVLKGTLREGGRSLGLKPVLEAASGTPLAGAFGLFSPYRLLTSDARFGTAAWDWASEALVLGDGAVEVRWAPDAERPLAITAVYRWAAPNTLDFAATVKPQKDLARFELFLASYFDGFPASFAYVRENPQADGKPGFMEARKASGDWQAFPRDDAAPQIITDGRWKREPNPVEWKIMPRLAAPLAVRRDAKTGLAAVLMAPASDCFAVMMPYGEEGHRSVYLSLFGRDLKAGEDATARARLVIGRDITDAQAVALWGDYVRGLARP